MLQSLEIKVSLTAGQNEQFCDQQSPLVANSVTAVLKTATYETLLM